MIDFDLPVEWLKQTLEVSVQPAIPTDRGISFQTMTGELLSVLPGALLIRSASMDGKYADVLVPKAVIQHVRLSSSIAAPRVSLS